MRVGMPDRGMPRRSASGREVGAGPAQAAILPATRFAKAHSRSLAHVWCPGSGRWVRQDPLWVKVPEPDQGAMGSADSPTGSSAFLRPVLS